MKKIFKSKFYICKFAKDRKHIIVKLEYGVFDTESKASRFMAKPAPLAQQVRPGAILLEKKPEFRDGDFTTVKGERILKFPRVYLVE